MSGTRRKPGRLGPFVEDYRAWLSEREYTPGTTRNMLKELGVLGRWMSEQGVEPGRLDAAAIEAFLAARRAAGQRRVPSLRAMHPLVSFLREAGVMAPDDGPEQLTPLERFVAEYRDWLVGERGLAETTVIRYERLARRFMAGRVADAGELDVAGLTGADVSAFLLEECARVSVGSAKGRDRGAAVAAALPLPAPVHGHRAGRLGAVGGRLAQYRDPGHDAARRC